MITLRLVLHLILILLALLFNHLGKWPFLQTLIFFLMALPLIALISGFILRRRVKLGLSTEAELVERGEVARWIIRVDNPSFFFTLFCHARLRSARLYPDQPYLERDFLLPRRGLSEIRFEHSATHCGPLELSALELWLKDPFGFFMFKLTESKKLEALDKIYVLPQKMDLLAETAEAEMQLEEGAFLAKKSMSEIDEIDRMRQMQPGDRIKSIHWKLSARVQDWMVKQYEKAEERQVLFLFDLPKIPAKASNLEREDTLFLRDTILEHSTALLERFLMNDFIVKLLLSGVQPANLTASKISDFEFLRQALAKIPLDPPEALEMQLRDELTNPEKKLFFVITDSLTASSVGLLSVLQKENAGCVLAYYIADAISAEQYELLSELALAKVKILLYNRYGEEVHDESIQL
ncbi:MAG: DUF58 domain-containing protein [Eubacteriales bacterium]|nr:DUF58 domain-containing protein [Eubacteriales bacterium]